MDLFDLAEDDDWQEVPQALFLSWSEARQYLYCAERDAQAATLAETEEEISFYIERAKAYRALCEQAKI